jgi:hypothetical protein
MKHARSCCDTAEDGRRRDARGLLNRLQDLLSAEIGVWLGHVLNMVSTLDVTFGFIALDDVGTESTLLVVKPPPVPVILACVLVEELPGCGGLGTGGASDCAGRFFLDPGQVPLLVMADPRVGLVLGSRVCLCAAHQVRISRLLVIVVIWSNMAACSCRISSCLSRMALITSARVVVCVTSPRPLCHCLPCRCREAEIA